jgi:hypothetical protein
MIIRMEFNFKDPNGASEILKINHWKLPNLHIFVSLLGLHPNPLCNHKNAPEATYSKGSSKQNSEATYMLFIGSSFFILRDMYVCPLLRTI